MNTMKWFTLFITTCFSSLALAQSPGYQETGRPAVQHPEGKIEVVEYFWFGCPHCYALEPYIKKWLETKPDWIDFRREAPPFNKNWQVHSQAFFAAELMGVSDVVVEPIFDAIHRDKKSLNSVESIASFVGELGVDEQTFASTMQSFAVQGRMSRAGQSAIQYGLRGVPAIVVHGKYLTSGSIAGSYDRMIEVINTLAEQEYQTQ